MKFFIIQITWGINYAKVPTYKSNCLVSIEEEAIRMMRANQDLVLI